MDKCNYTTDYCINNCEIGKKKAKELLHNCDSVFDAAIDMQYFVKNCIESHKCDPTKLQTN